MPSSRLIALGVLGPALLMIGAQRHDDVAHADCEEHEPQHGQLPLTHAVLHHAQQQRVAVVELEALQREQEREQEQQRGRELFETKAAVFTTCAEVLVGVYSV